MTAADIFHEWTVASAHPGTGAALSRYGVNDRAAISLCGLEHVEHDSSGFYQPHPCGHYAVIVPLIVGGEIFDLIAFDPRRADRWWWRLGGEPVLGASALSDQLMGCPLHVYRSPLSWLQSGGDGIVPLDLNRAAIDLISAQYGIVAEDDAHVGELQRALSEAAQRRTPDIYLRTSEAA